MGSMDWRKQAASPSLLLPEKLTWNIGMAAGMFRKACQNEFCCYVTGKLASKSRDCVENVLQTDGTMKNQPNDFLIVTLKGDYSGALPTQPTVLRAVVRSTVASRYLMERGREPILGHRASYENGEIEPELVHERGTKRSAFRSFYRIRRGFQAWEWVNIHVHTGKEEEGDNAFVLDFCIHTY